VYYLKNTYTTLNEFYYEFHDTVKIKDLQTIVPEFSKDMAKRREMRIEI